MKKIFLFIIAIIVIGTAAIYFNIPPNIAVSKSQKINSNIEAAFRYLRTDSNWQKWWPGEIENEGGIKFLVLDDYRFSLKQVLYNSFQLNIESDKDTIISNLYLVPIVVDTLLIQWESNISSGKDPITKIKRYFLMKNLGRAYEKIISRMEDHLTKPVNIYGLDIKKEKVRTQHLISMKNTYLYYPGTADIYNMVGKIRDYIAETGAKEQGEPMLNIFSVDSIQYDVQVAIPVDKILTGNNVFTSKWMMKGGNILVSDVRGGMNAINRGFRTMEVYISDYRRTIIAIPFQMLVTDRRKEMDSTKWITRLYYPVM